MSNAVRIKCVNSKLTLSLFTSALTHLKVKRHHKTATKVFIIDIYCNISLVKRGAFDCIECALVVIFKVYFYKAVLSDNKNMNGIKGHLSEIHFHDCFLTQFKKCTFHHFASFLSILYEIVVI